MKKLFFRENILYVITEDSVCFKTIIISEKKLKTPNNSDDRTNKFEIFFDCKSIFGNSLKIKDAVYVEKLDSLFLLMTHPKMKYSLFVKKSLVIFDDKKSALAKSISIKVGSFEVNNKFQDHVFFSKKNKIFRLKLQPLIEINLEIMEKRLSEIDNLILHLENIQNESELNLNSFADKILDTFQIDLQFIKELSHKKMFVLRSLFEIEALKIIQKQLDKNYLLKNDRSKIFSNRDKIETYINHEHLKLSYFNLDQDWSNQIHQLEYLSKVVILGIFLKIRYMLREENDFEKIKNYLEKLLPEFFAEEENESGMIKTESFDPILEEYLSFKTIESIINTFDFEGLKLLDKKDKIIREAKVDLDNQIFLDNKLKIDEDTDFHFFIFLQKVSK